jgi:hypothetical protein
MMSSGLLFQKVVTTDKRLRFRNQDRLRAFIAAHPEIDVFAVHDPTALPMSARVDRFFRSGPAGETRRTLIYNNGSDGPVTSAWVQGVADALDRGWNAVTFDGPGQNAAPMSSSPRPARTR